MRPLKTSGNSTAGNEWNVGNIQFSSCSKLNKASCRVANTFLTELSQATLVIDDDVKTMLIVFLTPRPQHLSSQSVQIGSESTGSCLKVDVVIHHNYRRV